MFHKFIPREGQEDPIFGTADDEETSGQQGTNLADLILEKIAEFEAKQSGQEPNVMGGGAPEDAVQLPMKVIEVYSKCVPIFPPFSPPFQDQRQEHVF